MYRSKNGILILLFFKAHSPPHDLFHYLPSPYDRPPSVSAKHNEAFLSSLEAQNEDEVSSMSQKVAALKNLGVKMGDQINTSMKLNDEITNSFEKGRVTLKNTYNKMIVMSQRAGISWKMWLAFFAMFFLWCFYVWLF
ncbi:hypothetical protein CA7LBN_004753 [Candidozyma auris]|uniref:t-SNARE coiled-coil homology domain-containing protein n=1 Tax=Candidozyma auris TaxID=498019 RepID=A0A8F2W4X6_CANAR|nr:hypothetical protein CA7LBN_004753 [[Candida] auris]